VPDLVSDSEGEDEEIDAEQVRPKKKRESGAARPKANHSESGKKARGEPKVRVY
jgi:hypothetical protein